MELNLSVVDALLKVAGHGRLLLRERAFFRGAKDDKRPAGTFARLETGPKNVQGPKTGEIAARQGAETPETGPAGPLKTILARPMRFVTSLDACPANLVRAKLARLAEMGD